jgi:hypothetical protein
MHRDVPALILDDGARVGVGQQRQCLARAAQAMVLELAAVQRA